jgi:hypothetical protein
MIGHGSRYDAASLQAFSTERFSLTLSLAAFNPAARFVER